LSVIDAPESGLSITLKNAMARSLEAGAITSGSQSIDSLLDGGYKIGEIVEIFGESKTGKTQLALQASLSCSSSNSSVLFVDTEGTFRPERIESMARARGLESHAVLQRVYRTRARDAPAQFEALDLLDSRAELRNCGMIVVDSVAKNFSMTYPGGENLPRRQGILNVYLSRLARDAVLNRRVVLLTNRVASFGDREAHLGGETLSQLVHRSIHLRRREGKITAILLSGGVEAKRVEAVISEEGFS